MRTVGVPHKKSFVRDQKQFRDQKRKLHPSAHGGALRNRRIGRGARPISVRYSMHLVLRSSHARGAWSFVRRGNRELVQRILLKHASKSQVELLAAGNAGSHLHLRLRVRDKSNYFKFIRAVAGEIALKFKRLHRPEGLLKHNFWDQRPFSTIVSTLKYAQNLTDYIKINQVEGSGFSREVARMAVEKWRLGIWREFGDA